MLLNWLGLWMRSKAHVQPSGKRPNWHPLVHEKSTDCHVDIYRRYCESQQSYQLPSQSPVLVALSSGLANMGRRQRETARDAPGRPSKSQPAAFVCHSQQTREGVENGSDFDQSERLPLVHDNFHRKAALQRCLAADVDGLASVVTFQPPLLRARTAVSDFPLTP